MGNRAKVTRVGSHLVVWTLVVVPAILELVRGWRPLNDDATISFRGYQVFSAHPPLLGQYQSVSAGAALSPTTSVRCSTSCSASRLISTISMGCGARPFAGAWCSRSPLKRFGPPGNGWAVWSWRLELPTSR